MIEDDETTQAMPEADAYGQAALVLAESLIHELAARSVLTAEQALFVAEVAHDTQVAIADEAPKSVSARMATGLLQRVMLSLQADLRVAPTVEANKQDEVD